MGEALLGAERYCRDVPPPCQAGARAPGYIQRRVEERAPSSVVRALETARRAVRRGDALASAGGSSRLRALADEWRALRTEGPSADERFPLVDTRGDPL